MLPQKFTSEPLAKVRARVEQVFGHQQNSMNGKIVRAQLPSA